MNESTTAWREATTLHGQRERCAICGRWLRAGDYNSMSITVPDTHLTTEKTTFYHADCFAPNTPTESKPTPAPTRREE